MWSFIANYSIGVFGCWPATTITITGVMAYIPKLGWDFIYNPNAVQHQPGTILMFLFGAVFLGVQTDMIFQMVKADLAAKNKLATIENDPVALQFKKSELINDPTFNGPALKEQFMKDTPEERFQHMKEFVEKFMGDKLNADELERLRNAPHSPDLSDLFFKLVDQCHLTNEILQFDKARWVDQLALLGFTDYQLIAGFTVFFLVFAIVYNVHFPYHLFGIEHTDSIPKQLVYHLIDNFRQVAFDDTRVILSAIFVLSAGAGTAADLILPLPVETTPTILYYLRVCLRGFALAVKYFAVEGVNFETNLIVKIIKYFCNVFGHLNFASLLLAIHFITCYFYYTVILAQPWAYYHTVHRLHRIGLALYDHFLAAHPDRPRGIFTSMYIAYVVITICSLILYWIYGPPYGR